MVIALPLSLYIHIPFCTRKCDYCHFYVVPHKPEFVALYLQALALDIALAHDTLVRHPILTLYLGGGTPSLLTTVELDSLFALLRPYLSHVQEITFEANPESLTQEKVIHLKALGVNRISIGIQSFHQQELTLLGRAHAPSIAEKAVYAAYNGGIENISIDLIYDLPHQTKEGFAESLAKATSLPITHLSLYNLTIEPHTLFYKRRKELEPLLPDSDSSLAMWEEAEMHLEKQGLQRYEISAFAKPGKESLHNSGYWTGRSYLGLGPSAHSFYDGIRSCKKAHLHRWAKALQKGDSPLDFSEKLSPSAALRERIAIGLRLCSGVELQEMVPELLALQTEGFVIIENGRVLLTKKGRLFYDHVAESLIEVE